MKKAITRKQFLTQGAATAGSLLAMPSILSAAPAKSASEKLNVAIIGAGGMGAMAVGASGKENIVAFCDVDPERASKAYKKHPKVPTYQDFRVMLDKHENEIDVVLISTPDHTHFVATIASMERGKHVFVQKPLTHDIWQARTLQKAAAKYNVKNIMGNQGRCGHGIRQIKEWIDSGLIGDVAEVHAWTVRPYAGWRYPTKKLPVQKMPVPKNLDWDSWLGPVATIKDYNSCYVPKLWRAWWDLGNAAMGDIGCHLLDAPYWALDLTGPVSVKSEAAAYHPQMTPAKAITTLKYPARGNKVPITVKWYEGGNKPEVPEGFDFGGELPKKLPKEGILIKGSKHTIYHPDIRADNPVILMAKDEWEEFQKSELPAETIPRLKKGFGPVQELFSAIRGGPEVGSDFDYAAPLTELCCLGTLALRTGKQVDYDPASMSFKDASLNPYIKAPVRPGWEYGDDLW